MNFSNNNRGAVGTGVELECIRKQSTVDNNYRRDRWIYCVSSGLDNAQSLLPNSLSKEELMSAETVNLNAGLHVHA